MYHPPYSVFISYPDEDKYYKDTLCNFLAYMDIECLVAEHQKSAGEEIWDKIIPMIRFSTRVLLLYTTKAPKSEWMKREITIARTFQKRFIPVKEDGVALPSAVKGEDREYIPFNREDFAYTVQKICQQVYVYRDRTPHVFRFVTEDEREFDRKILALPWAKKAFWSNAYVDELVQKGIIPTSTIIFIGKPRRNIEIVTWISMHDFAFFNREAKPNELGLENGSRSF